MPAVRDAGRWCIFAASETATPTRKADHTGPRAGAYGVPWASAGRPWPGAEARPRTTEVGGACRHLIADRLDITGARWGLHGADAVLRLRTVTANGDLDTYWCCHTAREHQRLYPTPDQQEDRLTA